MATKSPAAAVDAPAVNKGGRPYKYKPEFFQSKVDEYIDRQFEQNKPITKSGFSLYIGCDSDTISNLIDVEGYSAAIKKLVAAGEQFEVEYLHTGKNPAGAIFVLKNLHGWADKQEIEYSGSIQLLPPDVDGLIAAYQRLESAKQQRQITDAITVESELL